MNGDCARVRDAAAELALGLVTGQERAEVLAHLEECADCRAEVRGLTAVTDSLRGLVPPAEPPAGFEQRVLDRLRPAPARGRRARVLLAAGLVGVAVFGAGWVTGSARPAGQTVAAAVAEPLVSGERRVGDIVVDRDRPDVLSVWLEAPAAGRLTCDLLRRDGSVAASVTYDAAGGADRWGVPRPGEEVTRMRIADAAGGVVASGAVPTGS